MNNCIFKSKESLIQAEVYVYKYMNNNNNNNKVRQPYVDKAVKN